MSSKREGDAKEGGSKSESKKSRFGEKKQNVEKKQTLEKAKRILELADKLNNNPLLKALKEGKASVLQKEKEKDKEKEPHRPRRYPRRPPLPSQSEALAEARGSKYYDPNVLLKPERRRRQFMFIEQGQFEQEAELERLRLKYGDHVADRIDKGQVRGLRGVKWEDIQRYLDAGNKKYDLEQIKDELKEGRRREPDEIETSNDEMDEMDVDEEIPEIEWWDQTVLDETRSEGYGEEPFPVKGSRISQYIEHPIPIEPPGELVPPPPPPLRLTKKEMRKLRTQRRQQRERERQELIKQGLLEPPKPKVKLSNMMRVLAEEAATDPTAVEREIRKQMLERRKAHEDRNLARKLTPGERKHKHLKKLFSNESGDHHVCLLFHDSRAFLMF